MITLSIPQRQNKGPWKPGVSGNPGGRPSRAGDVDIAALARTYSVDALHTLVKCLRDERFKLQAAIAILDRGYGKPHVSVHSQSESTVLHLLAAQATGAELLAAAMSDDDKPTIEASVDASGDAPTE